MGIYLQSYCYDEKGTKMDTVLNDDINDIKWHKT
jgi:hypothetical protein